MEQVVSIKENNHSGLRTADTHYHASHQILYNIEDECKITLNQERKKFPKDTLAFIPPYYKHSTASDTEVIVLELNFDIKSLDPEIGDALVKTNFDTSLLVQLNPIEIVHVRQLLRRMLYEYSQDGQFSSLSFKNLLEALLILLVKKEDSMSASDANEYRAKILKEYIDTHYFEINDASEFSNMLGISLRHINTIFKNQFNTTPTQYLDEVRIETAKNLLAETNLNVVSICFKVGYESLPTFYRHFKNHTNLAPNEFRIQFE